MKSERSTEKFIVGYFSMIGFYLLFSFFVASFFGLGNVASPFLITILYSLVLYLLWKDRKLVIKIAVSSFLSFAIGGIIFVFTFPIWMVFGPVCVIYGLFTGLFKKQSGTLQTENTIPATAPQVPNTDSKSKKFKPAIGIAILVACLYIIYHVSFYGFKLNTCIYTEEPLTVPSEILNNTLLLENNIYLAKGKDPDHCSDSFKGIVNDLVDNETIGNVTVGVDYFTRQGRTIQSLPKGKRFTIEKIISQTKHGLSTIDSGPGPLYFLILKDENGVLYQVCTVYLGKEHGEVSLTYLNNNSKYVLSSEYFDHLYDKDWNFPWEESIKYDIATSTTPVF